MNPKAFISYSQDSLEYKDWVRNFADRLINDGVDTVLDQYDLQLGDMNPKFMEQNIATCDYILIFITENYTKKADERVGGVGYETNLTTSEIIIKGNRKKFIPVLIKIDFANAPKYLQGVNSIKIKSLLSFELQYETIYRTITDQTLKKPPLGKIRTLSIGSSNDQFEIDKLLKCKTHNNWVNASLIIDVASLSNSKLYEYFEIFKQNRPLGDKIQLPYVFMDKNKKSHSPQIVYESEDYFSAFNNWAAYDKLIFEENIIHYSYLEFREGTPLLITGSLLLGSIYSIFCFLYKSLKALNKKIEIEASFNITGSSDMFFYIQDPLLKLEESFGETYLLKQGTNKATFSFKKMDVEEIQKFTNAILGMFISQNPNSTVPFASTTIAAVKPFFNSIWDGKRYLFY